ncbi:hypothetical protein F5B22DRAFT_592438 [Xylaria bambusicola]|uniref:uncharacterized protein n=1 Tax=Xylaria bambusicola TaxID=326684 RepID=UPI002007E462|nr:uncharacterized protein F5B22DRAFT_592438 [Xylaria bambusicola]KAI0523903.1 hypothetical protein F5B22DRAFT_592438 [Xylaria bambusicola]
MNTQNQSSGGPGEQHWMPRPATDSGYGSSNTHPQQYDNPYAEVPCGAMYNAAASNMNQSQYPHDQSCYTRDSGSFETKQSSHQQGHKLAVMQGNEHRGEGNQYLGVVNRQPMPGVTDEVMLTATANLLIRNNHFAAEGRGNQVIGQAVGPGAIPMAFSGQYEGNINDGPGDQLIGISFEHLPKNQRRSRKKYESIFNDFERQKTTLALYISQLNDDRLGEITPTVNKIWTKLQCIPEQQVGDEDIHQKEQDTILSVQECHRTAVTPSVTIPVAERLDKRGQENTQTSIYHQIQNNHEKSSHTSGRNTPQHITALPCSTSSEGDAKQDSAVCLTDDSSMRGMPHPEDSTKLPAPMTQGSAVNTAQETNAFHLLNPSPFTEFKGNVHRGGGTQTIGVHLGRNANMTRVTDADMLKVTSNFLAHANIFSGNGTQTIGQLVQSGATPRQFSGHYYNNHHEGTGDQVIGISFE